VLGTGGTWREIVPHRPGVRVEDVDAFSDVLVLSERADAETWSASCRSGPEDDPFAGDLLSASWIVPSTESPSSSWLGANPEPEVTSCGSAARPW
jgi:protease II